MTAQTPTIAVIIPCYNEEPVLALTTARLVALIDRMADSGMVSGESFLLCCDDGSRDDTWEVIRSLHEGDRRIKGISLAHNRGQQNALYAGLMTVRGKCDAAVSIDADLQDDPEAIIRMVEEFRSGKEIVYGVRSDRKSDSWFKRASARGVYRVQKWLGADTVYDHADFRLMSARALEMLSQYREANLFIRGIIPQIGLDTAVVRYERSARAAGQTKYTLGKMVGFSIDGITSFSAKPMRIIFIVGLVLLLVVLVVAVYVLVQYFNQKTISGWASLMLSVWALGGLLMTSIGIVGEYIGKIFIEVKNRPRYAVKETLMD